MAGAWSIRWRKVVHVTVTAADVARGELILPEIAVAVSKAVKPAASGRSRGNRAVSRPARQGFTSGRAGADNANADATG